MNSRDKSDHDDKLAIEPRQITDDPELPERIRRLVNGEPYGVLCTQGEGEPYGSLVAFAFSDDLDAFVFATPKETRKYGFLKKNDGVALVIDTRGRYPDDMTRVEALTVTGRADEIKDETARQVWSLLLGERHPHLKQFITAETSALFKVSVTKYYHVSRFQELRQWHPTDTGHKKT